MADRHPGGKGVPIGLRVQRRAASASALRARRAQSLSSWGESEPNTFFGRACDMMMMMIIIIIMRHR